MIFSESRYPPIGSKPEGMLFRIMLQPCVCLILRTIRPLKTEEAAN